MKIEVQLSGVIGVLAVPPMPNIKCHLETTYGGQIINTANFSCGASICIKASTAFLVAKEHRSKRNVTVDATAPLLEMLEINADHAKQTCPHTNKNKNNIPKSFKVTYFKLTKAPAIMMQNICIMYLIYSIKYVVPQYTGSRIPCMTIIDRNLRSFSYIIASTINQIGIIKKNIIKLPVKKSDIPTAKKMVTMMDNLTLLNFLYQQPIHFCYI